MDNSKPPGIVLIAIYSVLFALMTLNASFIVLLLSALSLLGFWGLVASFATTFYAIFLLASVYGLWSLQTWGWKFTLWLNIVGVALNILLIFPVLPYSEFTMFNTAYQLIAIAINFTIIWYLNTGNILIKYEVV